MLGLGGEGGQSQPLDSPEGVLQLVDEPNRRQQEIGNRVEDLVDKLDVISGRPVLIDQVVEDLPDQVGSVLHLEFVEQVINHLFLVLGQQVLVPVIRVLAHQIDDLLSAEDFLEQVPQRFVTDHRSQPVFFGNQGVLPYHSHEFLTDNWQNLLAQPVHISTPDRHVFLFEDPNQLFLNQTTTVDDLLS